MILKGIIDNDRYRIETNRNEGELKLRVMKYLIVHSKVSNKVSNKIYNDRHKRQVQKVIRGIY